MPNSDTLIGRTFGQLTVVSSIYENTPYAGRQMICQCGCGALCLVRPGRLIDGSRVACTACENPPHAPYRYTIHEVSTALIKVVDDETARAVIVHLTKDGVTNKARKQRRNKQ